MFVDFSVSCFNLLVESAVSGDMFHETLVQIIHAENNHFNPLITSWTRLLICRMLMYSRSTFDLAERYCLPLLVVMYLDLQGLLLCVLHLPPHLPFMYLGGLALTFHSKMLVFGALCNPIRLNLVTHSLWHSLCTQFTEIVFTKHDFS